MAITFQEIVEFLHKLEQFIIEITIITLTSLKCITIVINASKENLSDAFTLFEDLGYVSQIYFNINIFEVVAFIVLFMLISIVYLEVRSKLNK